VTLVDPSQGRGYPTEGKQVSDTTVPLAPKMFAFDGIFTDEDPQVYYYHLNLILLKL